MLQESASLSIRMGPSYHVFAPRHFDNLEISLKTISGLLACLECISLGLHGDVTMLLGTQQQSASRQQDCMLLLANAILHVLHLMFLLQPQ